MLKTAWLFLSGIALVAFVSLIAQSITKGSNPFSSMPPITISSYLVTHGAGATLPLDPVFGIEAITLDETIAMSDIDQKPTQPILSDTILGVVLFDYGEDDPIWYTVNDDVMGGVSASTVSVDPETQRLTFSGNLSLENGGGFASIRSPWTAYDLGGYDGITLRVRGDGNIYRFRIRTEESGTQISYTALFKTEVDEWQEIYIPFSEMTPLYRGLVVNGVGPLDPTSIRSFGLMLADGQQGEFLLEVDWISAVTVE